MKTLLYNSFALLVLAVPFTGCSSYSAHPVSKSAQQSPARDERLSERAHANSDQGSSNNQRLKLPLVQPHIEVWKAERKLLLFSDERIVRTYHVGLGSSPVGDKVRSGDHRTPEGDFYIFIKNPKSAFYLSLGISYPNLAHAQRGLRDGLITPAQYDRIAEALRKKKSPPQDTRLGGTIYIHGNGSRADWTWGCVALENEDVKELYQAVEVGTPVSIKP
jgi:murein L,D-transpeptidase YafK